MASLVLIRHGNTFEAGQTPVWVGARTDLPLTAEGERQAEAAAVLMAEKVAPVSSIITGPLQRTRRMAALLAARLNAPVILDNRLREIDYGQWEGLSHEEITARYGPATLEGWERESLWPENMGWKPSFADVQKALRAFLEEQRQKLTPPSPSLLAVTSNGILRLIHALASGQDGAAAKVKTGHFCVLEPEKTGWRIVAWNEKP